MKSSRHPLGVDPARLRRFAELVDESARAIGLPGGIEVRATMPGDVPNARVRHGRIEATPALIADDEKTQRFYAAHEVSHLSNSCAHPVVDKVTSRATFMVGLSVLLVALAGSSVVVPLMIESSGLVVVAIAAIGTALGGLIASWSANSRREEYAADRVAVTALRNLGHDAGAVAAHVMTQDYFTPKELSRLDYLVATHPRAGSRLQRIHELVAAG